MARPCVQTTAEVGHLAGIARAGGQIVGQLVGFAYAAAPSEIERGVGDDPVQPGAERLADEKAVEGAIGMQEPFLHGVFGVLVVGRDGAGHRIRPPLVRANQLAERVGTALLGGRDQEMLVMRSERRITRHHPDRNLGLLIGCTDFHGLLRGSLGPLVPYPPS